MARKCSPTIHILLFPLLLSYSQLPPPASDEFQSPTHTPSVQIVVPTEGECIPARRSFTVAIAASPGAEITLSIEAGGGDAAQNRDLASSLVFRRGERLVAKVQGLPPGQYSMTAKIISMEGVQDSKPSNAHSQVTVDFFACDCGEGRDPPKVPQANRGLMPALENPLLPGIALHHHSLVAERSGWQGALEVGYLVDWLGVRTRYAWDCIPGGGYYTFVPSRRMHCVEYDGLVDTDAAPGSRGVAVKGFYPPVDDEYPEYIDMLRSVRRSSGRHYTVVEVGSSFGVWGVRAVAAYRRMFPSGTYSMVAVESTAHRYRQLVENVKANGVENATALFAAILAPGDKPDESCTSDDAKMLTLDQVLADHNTVDYLDLDIQGQEIAVFANSDTLKVVTEKVKSVHIGTHSPDIHRQLRALFEHEGWIKELDYEHNMRYKCDEEMRNSTDMLPKSEECMTDTVWGPVYIRDGMLSFFNPEFADEYLDAFTD